MHLAAPSSFVRAHLAASARSAAAASAGGPNRLGSCCRTELACCAEVGRWEEIY